MDTALRSSGEAREDREVQSREKNNNTEEEAEMYRRHLEDSGTVRFV